MLLLQNRILMPLMNIHNFHIEFNMPNDWLSLQILACWFMGCYFGVNICDWFLVQIHMVDFWYIFTRWIHLLLVDFLNSHTLLVLVIWLILSDLSCIPWGVYENKQITPLWYNCSRYVHHYVKWMNSKSWYLLGTQRHSLYYFDSIRNAREIRCNKCRDETDWIPFNCIVYS